LCDFGISGNLINSNAFSRNNAGCAGYMAPERIDPIDPKNPVYDIRADVWSLGVTLVELATGEYPYKNCNNEFEVMSTILTSEAPRLEGDHFSDMFKSFVNKCLTKDVAKRPKYSALMQDPFILHYKEARVDVKSWFKSVSQAHNNNEVSSLDQVSSIAITPSSTPTFNSTS
jgi:serine/threonine protein kinase